MKRVHYATLLMGSLILSTLFFSFTMSEHQPELSSTMLVERADGTWVLQVRAALTAFEFEVHTHYGKDSYETPEAFNNLVIKHLINNISIAFNGEQAVKLQKGYVKLGHETNVIFEMPGVPKEIIKVIATNTGFKDIQDNKSALIILKKGFEKKQFMLDNNNNHTAQLKALENQFEQQ